MSTNILLTWKFWKNYVFFVSGVIASFLFTLTAEWLHFWGIGLAISSLLALTAYYVVTFFKDEPSGEKLLFFAFTLVFLIFYFGLLYNNFGIISTVGDEINLFNAIYFSVVTWTTLGYGDFLPASDETKYFIMVEALIGYIYMGVLVGKVIVMAQAGKHSNNEKWT